MKDEVGEDTAIHFGRMEYEQNVEWFSVDHADRDGAGGFLDVLNSLGLDCAMPTARQAGRLNRNAWRGWKLEQIKGYVPKPLRWRAEAKVDLNPPPPGQATVSSIGLAPPAGTGGFAWQELDAELVIQLMDYASLKGVSFNSLLTWAVARHLVPWFHDLEPQQSIHVGSAANVRPPGNQHRSNHSVQYTVVVDSPQGPVEVHQQVKQILSSGGLVAMDRFFRTIGCVPKGVLKQLFRRDYRSGQLNRPISHVLFSNLGEWTLPEESSAWIFAPCAFVRQPLVIGAVSVNRRWVFAVKSHPSTGLTTNSVAAGLADFVQSLAQLGEIKSDRRKLA